MPDNSQNKYKLLADDTIITKRCKILYRIRALRDIPWRVKSRNLGGYVESENNLSHDGTAWVSGHARISGNAKINRNCDIIWFSHVGSEYGALTCYTGQDGQIRVTCGCFSGTGDKFLAAVEKKHGASRIAKEYRLLMEVARLRLQPEGANV